MDPNCLLEVMSQQMPPHAAAAWKTRLLQSQNASSNSDLLHKISNLVKGGDQTQYSSLSNNNSGNNALKPVTNQNPFPMKSSNNGLPLSHALFRQTLTPLIPDCQVNECQAGENPSPNSILAGPESSPRLSQSLSSVSPGSLSPSELEQVLKIQLFQNDRANPFSSSATDPNSMDYDSLLNLLSGNKVMTNPSMQSSFDQQNNGRLLEQLLFLQNLNAQTQQIGMQEQKDQIRQHLESQYLQNSTGRSNGFPRNGLGLPSNKLPCNYSGLGDSGDLGYDMMACDNSQWFKAPSSALEGDMNGAFLSNWDGVSEPVNDWSNLGQWFSDDSKSTQTAASAEDNSPKLTSGSAVSKPLSRASNLEPNIARPSTVSVPSAPQAEARQTSTPVTKTSAPVTNGDSVRTAPVQKTIKPGHEPISNEKLHQILSQIPTRRKRGAATDMQSLAARARRERITRKMRTLHELVPGGRHLDTAAMLQQAIEYVRSLQAQLDAAKKQGVVIKTKEEIDREMMEKQHR